MSRTLTPEFVATTDVYVNRPLMEALIGILQTSIVDMFDTLRVIVLFFNWSMSLS